VAAHLHQRPLRGPGGGDEAAHGGLDLAPERLGIEVLVAGEELDRAVVDDLLQRPDGQVRRRGHPGHELRLLGEAVGPLDGERGAGDA
jgi:hypothetical protein